MRTRPGPFVITLLLFLCLGGCTHRAAVPSVEIAYAGPVGIDVQSFGGDVLVKVDPTATALTVTFVREALHGPLRDEEAKASLENIETTAVLEQGVGLTRLLKIRTTTTDPEPHFQRAHIRVTVPDADGINIHTRDGEVQAVGIQGEVYVVTRNADVYVATNLPLLLPVTIVNENGNIDLRMRAESNGELDFQTVGGKLISNVTHGDIGVHPGSDHNTLLATYNRGGNPVFLRTVEGDIRFSAVPDPLGYRVMGGF